MPENPVTVIVDRNVCPGNEAAFEALYDKIKEASGKFKGYITGHIMKPKQQGDNRYQVMFQFDNQDNLEKWISSNERKYWIDQIDPLLDKPTHLQVITGFETWFALPGQKTITPPKRHKMAVVTWLAITPLLILFNYFVGPFIKDLPLPIKVSVSTPGLVIIMTYLLMPMMTKLFKFWLYPNLKQKNE